MRSKWFAGICCLLLAVFLLSGCASSQGPKAVVPAGYERITMVGSSVGSGGTTAAMAVGKVLSKFYPEINWAVRSGATGVNVVQVTDGIIKMAMMVPSNYIDAFGAGKEAQSRLRSLVIPMPLTNYMFLIPVDKPWKDITQVPKGLTLCAGSPGTSIPPLAEVWLKLVGLSKSDFNWVELGKAAMVDAWRSGKIDFTFQAAIPGEVMLMDLGSSPRKVKLMGLSDEQLAKAKAERTFEKVGYVTPEKSDLGGAMPDIFSYDVSAPKSPYHLVVRDDFPEDIAYNIAKVLDEHHQDLIDTFRSTSFATPQNHIRYSAPPAAIHPGVAKYYKEKGYLK